MWGPLSKLFGNKRPFTIYFYESTNFRFEKDKFIFTQLFVTIIDITYLLKKKIECKNEAFFTSTNG